MQKGWLSTAQALARLGVKRETLYAYVSRGLVPRRRGPDGRSYFRPEDIDRLARRGRRPAPAPIDLLVRSAITLVDGGRLYYRGRDADALCREHTFEDVAEFLWTGRLGTVGPWPRGRNTPGTFAAAAATMSGSIEWSVEGARTLMVALLESLPALGEPVDDSFAARVWARLTDAAPTPGLLRALDLALGLAADDGLTRSTLTARIVAASGGDLPMAVAAALGTVDAAVASSDKHPDGDPRAEPILELLRAEETLERLRHPDLGDALGALERVAGMPPGSAETVVGVARAAGWIAHALEEKEDPTPIRVRSVYTGPPPQPEPSRRMLDAVLSYLEDVDRGSSRP